ncbi:hypothetical protein F2Q70_00036384 [Brassica cretica]|uniref:Uncharacterized protein n=1 Tax=Brassica cretica TaxID=69181 RepID=A0A8S9JZ00_BRACR|nr:hypothetical protein F2Q68_00031590 [Brassica cretica]KAF2587211.1 hypothetical protein F2Q70_00036384 [Brassica cretica]
MRYGQDDPLPTVQNDGSKSPKEDLGLRWKASIRDSEHIDADKDERRQNKEKTRGGKARRSWRRPERPNAGAPEIALRLKTINAKGMGMLNAEWDSTG